MRLTVGVPLLLLTIGLVLMRSPLVGRIVREQVEALTGGRWQARHAAIMLNGQLIVSDASLRVPSIPGPAGELVSAPQAVIDVDWWQLAPLSWFSGSGGAATGPVVRAVRLAGPVFRLSQSTDDGSISLAGLTPPATTTNARTTLPRIDVIDGRIEFTEHSVKSGRYEELAIIPIAGALMPAPDGRPSFTVRLQEIGRTPSVSGQRRGMVLDGRADLAAGDATLKLLNLSFDAWPAESVPSAFRDLWRRLAVQGAVRQTVFTYSQKAGLSVNIQLDDVALTVPVPSEGAKGVDDSGFLSLRGVKGSIDLSTRGLEADLTGKLGQQDGLSHVKLVTRGLELDSGFRCEITGRDINVTEEATFLPYIPPIVRQYLRWFGGPTAVVDASVTIARADPTGGHAAEVTVPEGRMTFQNGRAAFHKFPYAFHDMAGEVTFDDTTIRIVRITGVGPKGSPLTATGLITPLTEDAQVDVKVDVDDVPVDEELLAAMRPTYRRLMEVLFSKRQYDALVARGLVRPVLPPSPPNPPAPPTGPGASAARAKEGEATPFEFGGHGRVHVHLQRPLGHAVEWTTNIGVQFERAGLVPEPFPFPIEASDLAIEVNDERTILKGGRFVGLHGGAAKVEATVRFGDSAAEPVDPRVKITATDVPVDELLLNAVPGEEPGPGAADAEGSGIGLNAKGILRRLDLRGLVDCDVELSAAAEAPLPPTLVGPRPLPPVSYAVEVHLGKMTAAPVEVLAKQGEALGGSSEPELCIRKLAGSVRVTEGRVQIDGLHAELGRIEATRVGTGDGYTSAAPAGEITLRLDAETTPPASADQGRLHAELQLGGLSLADSFEPAVRVFSSDAADFLAGVRKSRRPDGVIDALVTLDSPHARRGAPVEIGVEVTRAERLGVAALDGRLEISEPHGRVHVVTRDHRSGGAADGETVRFESLSGVLGFNGEPAGGFEANGSLIRDPHTGGVARADGLVCGLHGWHLEGSLTRAILSTMGGDSVTDGLQRLSPRGGFDASVQLSGGPGQSMVSGWIGPTSLRIVRNGVPIEFEKIGGRVTFRARDDGSLVGSVENGLMITPEWSAEGGASWAYSPHELGAPGRVNIDAAFTGAISTLGPQLHSVLPDAAARSLDKLSLSLGEPARLTHATLRASISTERPGDGAADSVAFDGTVEFAGLSGDVGVPFREAHGRLNVHVTPAGEGETPASDSDARPSPLSITVSGPSMRIAGVRLTDYRLSLEQTSPRSLSLTEATAECHGGRVLARGGMDWTTTDAGPGPGRLRLDTLIAGVNFAPLLDDLSARRKATPTDAEAAGSSPTAPAPAKSEDSTRGAVDARIAIESTEGDPASLTGCGAIRIAHGDVLDLPLILPLMEVSNLMAPINDPLDYMQATFYLRGRQAVFDDISVLSDSLAIVGSGTLTLPDMKLDMRFNSKSNHRVPILSDAFEALRDEIASTIVTGTIEHPDVRSEPLTTTRRMIGDILSPGRPRVNGAPADAARRERERMRER